MHVLTVEEGRPLAWYLDLEQQLAATTPDDELLFAWVAPPTVIYGHHQLAEAEVNLNYCREHGIDVVQRHSGGGCVYADSGNLMLSLVSPNLHSQQVFACYLERLRTVLEQLGLPATTTQHNDVLVGGLKVSGTACYATPTATIVHGTLLWDVDLDALTHAITPSPQKLQKHGVASVRQRVCNLRPLLTFDNITQLRDYILTHF